MLYALLHLYIRFSKSFQAICPFRLRKAQHHGCEASHHLQLVATSFEAKPQPRSFVPKMNNDVLASLEMMLTFGQMMLCLTAQMKKSKPIGLDFLCLATVLDDNELRQNRRQFFVLIVEVEV